MTWCATQRTLSPAQIRSQAVRAFRQHQRNRVATPQEIDSAIARALLSLAPRPLREPLPGETALAPAEVLYGVYHGLIGDL